MDILSVVILILLALWMYLALRHSVKLAKTGGCASCGGECNAKARKDEGKAQHEHTCSGSCASCMAACNSRKQEKGSL